MSAFLAWGLAFLILMGGGLGTVLGGAVSKFFIPFLQIGAMDKKKYSKPVVTEQKITLGVYGEYERTLTPDDRREYHGGGKGPYGDL